MNMAKYRPGSKQRRALPALGYWLHHLPLISTCLFRKRSRSRISTNFRNRMASCAIFGGRKSPQDSKCSISAHINSLDSNPRCRNWCLVVVVCCYLVSPWLKWIKYRLYLCRKRGVHCQGLLYCMLMILLLWFTIYNLNICPYAKANNYTLLAK